MPAREMLPGLGHAIELRVYRSSGLLHLDWWYDSPPTRPSRRWKRLREQFPVALTELIQEAIASTDAGDEIDLGLRGVRTCGFVVAGQC